MQGPERKKKFLKVNFDMVQSDKEFYLEKCNFNKEQKIIFNLLTGEEPPTIYQISMELNMCERKVSEIIRQIKLKMIKVIMFN